MGGVGLKVGIYGGSGYAGVQLVRLLAGHPEVGAMGVSSRGYAGRGIGEVYPQLAVEGEYVEPEEIDTASLDAAFVAYGHGESAGAVKGLLGAGGEAGSEPRLLSDGGDTRARAGGKEAGDKLRHDKRALGG